MPQIPISDPDDPRLDDYRNIPDATLLEQRGLFVAEGRLVVRRLLTSPFATRSLLVTDTALTDLGDAIEGHDLPVYVVPQRVMNDVAGFNVHRGCLAAGIRPQPQDWRALAAGARTIVVMEQVGNADNVGAIFRNAAAFGAGAVLLGPSCADPLYRKAIRTSMGAALQVPFAPMPTWLDDLGDLRGMDFTLVALTPSEDATPLDQCELSGKVALLLGHEGAGLSDAARAHASVLARIPMAGGTDSLNVATAAAVALYEFGNERRSG